MIKKIIIIFALISLTGCGFTPMYSKGKNSFSIEQTNFSGERELNNFLKTNLIRYKNTNDKKFFIEIESEYTKNILTKDKTGNITNFELLAKVTFTFKSSGKKIKFTEKKIIENLNDNFEQSKQERSIKQTFATSLTNKLISKLSLIQ